MSLQVLDTGKKGLGIVALRDYFVGDQVVSYAGPRISYNSWPADASPDYAIQISEEQYLDPRTGHTIFLANHSCHPNAGMVCDGSTFVLKAIRHIQPGDEVTWDYSTTMDDGTWTMKCLCGEPSCRKLVGDYKDLPHDVRAKYRQLGVVLNFLLRKYP